MHRCLLELNFRTANTKCGIKLHLHLEFLCNFQLNNSTMCEGHRTPLPPASKHALLGPPSSNLMWVFTREYFCKSCVLATPFNPHARTQVNLHFQHYIHIYSLILGAPRLWQNDDAKYPTYGAACSLVCRAFNDLLSAYFNSSTTLANKRATHKCERQRRKIQKFSKVTEAGMKFWRTFEQNKLAARWWNTLVAPHMLAKAHTTLHTA